MRPSEVNKENKMTEENNTIRNKGGRPRKDKYDLRHHHHKVGFTDLENDTIAYKAQQAGMEESEFIHDAALGAHVKSHISESQIEYVRDIAGMGNNINQLAHRANAEGIKVIEQECLNLLPLLGELLRRLVRGGNLTKEQEEEETTDDTAGNGVYAPNTTNNKTDQQTAHQDVCKD